MRRQEDAALEQDKALPVAAGSVYTTAFDLGTGTQDFVAGAEFRIEAPALAVTPLPNGETMKYSVEHSADNSSFADLLPDVLTQTGAAGAGAAAANMNVALPVDVYRYVRVKATGSTSIGNCSASEVTAKLVT